MKSSEQEDIRTRITISLLSVKKKGIMISSVFFLIPKKVNISPVISLLNLSLLTYSDCIFFHLIAVKFIEVSGKLPVMAFGLPIPALPAA